MEDPGNEQLPEVKNTAYIAVGISVVVLALIMLQHNLAFQNKGTIVLPAGGTYLGPTNTPTPTPPEAAQPTEAAAPVKQTDGADGSFTTTTGKLAVSSGAPWETIKGNKYPYSFQAPKALHLVTLPGGAPFDIYAISWNNQPPDQNVLIGVDDLNRTDALKQYVSVSKRSYVENWYKQFGLKGIQSITEFTNSKGLKGYRAKFLNASNQAPNDDVFFETPDPRYVIHLASGVLDITTVFNPLIDSVSWGK